MRHSFKLRRHDSGSLIARASKIRIRFVFLLIVCLPMALLLPSRSVPQNSPASGGQNQELGAGKTRNGQTATLLPDGRFLVVGGLGTNGPLATAVIRDPRTRETIPLPHGLRQARAWHTGTVLPDGSVLILGGVGIDGQTLNSAEVFHPEAQSFEFFNQTALTARAYHAATLLTEGQVLISGGLSSDGQTLDDVELWDSSNHRPTLLSTHLQVARSKHSASLLPDGDVLIWGGQDRQGVQLNEGELFNSVSQTLTGVFSRETGLNDLYLAASLPADGSVDVPINTNLALRFSRPLQVATVNANTMNLTGPEGAVPIRIVPAEGGLLTFITPKKPLVPGITYTLSISGPRDQTNASLPSSAIGFTTASIHAAQSQPLSDDEDWTPTSDNLKGDWRSGLPDLPPHETLPALQAPPGVTALAGRALTLQGQPIRNITLKLSGKSVKTDDSGRFLISPVVAGHHVLTIDGRTTGTPGKTYGFFKVGVDVIDGRTNVLPYTIWMSKIDTAHAISILTPTTTETVVTTPRIPGLELHIPAGSVIRDNEGQTGPS
jgi:Bacterial Ig-like domain/Galactose oxidase, central domain